MGHKICKKCQRMKTFPEFKFIGKGKAKKGEKGKYRSDICLACGGE